MRWKSVPPPPARTKVVMARIAYIPLQEHRGRECQYNRWASNSTLSNCTFIARRTQPPMPNVDEHFFTGHCMNERHFHHSVTNCPLRTESEQRNCLSQVSIYTCTLQQKGASEEVLCSWAGLRDKFCSAFSVKWILFMLVFFFLSPSVLKYYALLKTVYNNVQQFVEHFIRCN
jgi:hypothetical protein